MQNWHKWTLTLAVGFLGGLISAAADQGAGVGDYIRHGLIGMGPAVAGLKMTLGNGEAPKADAAGAGK